MTEVPRGVVKRSVRIAGHRTSLSLEAEFWDELKAIAAARGCSLNHLVAETDATRTGNLSSALRLLVLAELKRGAIISCDSAMAKRHKVL